MKYLSGIFITGMLSMLSSEKVRAQSRLEALAAAKIDTLVGDYRKLHQAPELSGHEEKTAAFVANRLRALGYEVTEHVGRFTERPWKGYGVVGMLKNGKGPAVLVRADMDALPIEEKTGLDYASTIRTVNDAGATVAVMHACGHDIHVTSLLGVAALLMELRQQWNGTLLLVAQPAEEGGPGGSGAEAMLNDGLYTRWPRPDYVLGLHQVPNLPAGQIGVTSGYSNAVSAGGEIIIHGVAAHPARPQDGKDPILLAAQMIIAFQTQVIHEVDPLRPATLTVGAIHGGVAENAIPDEVRLRLSFRALDPGVFDKMLASIHRVVRGIAFSAGIPDDKMPEVKIKKAYPANYNDPALTERIRKKFEQVLGQDRVQTMPPLLTGEDFSYYGLEQHIPTFYFNIGSTDKDKWQEAQRTGQGLPANHSPYLAPVPGETIRTGVTAMTCAVLELLKK